MLNGEIDDIKDIYSAGERFDEMLTYNNRKLKRWEEEVSAQFPANSKILDIGCGKGREAFCLNDKGFRLTGIDISETVIESAREIAKINNLDIEFAVSDGKVLPFPDETFDVVVIWAQTFGLFPDELSRQHILDECKRVLRKDGLLSFSTHDKEYLQENYSAFLVGNVFCPFEDTELKYAAYTIDELAAFAEEAGYVLSCERGNVYTEQDGTVLHCVCRRRYARRRSCLTVTR